MDHCGAPLHLGPYDAIRPAVWEHWRNATAMLARCPNVFVKVGGLGQQNPALGLGKRPLPPTSAELAAIIEPYVRHIIDTLALRAACSRATFPWTRPRTRTA